MFVDKDLLDLRILPSLTFIDKQVISKYTVIHILNIAIVYIYKLNTLRNMMAMVLAVCMRK